MKDLTLHKVTRAWRAVAPSVASAAVWAIVLCLYAGQATAQGQTPTVTGIGYYSSPADGETYTRHDTIWLWVQFNQPVQVFGQPRLTLTIGNSSRQASFFSYETSWNGIWFSYTVAESDRDDDGVGIPADALRLNSGAITLAGSSTTNAVLTHAAVPDDPDRKVDGSQVRPPAISNVSFSGSPSDGDTYGRDETIRVEVQFDKPVQMTGQVELTLTVGGASRQATPIIILPTFVYFGYLVQASDRDTDGLSIPADALTVTDGAITFAGTPAHDAVLTHAAVAADINRKVNGALRQSPEVSSVSFWPATEPPDGGTYGLDDAIWVEVGFDQRVRVTGEPQLDLTIGSSTRQAGYFSTTTTDSVRYFSYFVYRVQASDSDTDGLSIPANALKLNGGTISTLDEAYQANLEHGGVPADDRRQVDGTLIRPPRITKVRFSESPSSGDTIVVTRRFGSRSGSTSPCAWSASPDWS